MDMRLQLLFHEKKPLIIKARGESKNSENCQVGSKGRHEPPSRNSQGLQNMEYICKCSQNLEKLTVSDMARSPEQGWKYEDCLNI